MRSRSRTSRGLGLCRPSGWPLALRFYLDSRLLELRLFLDFAVQLRLLLQPDDSILYGISGESNKVSVA
jgi:hypothetical protein